MAINIEQTLKDRFAAPLPENYKRRILFWQDPDREFANLVDEICLDGVKTLKLTGTNNFAAKQLLAETDTESNYLVYNPLSYADSREDWLLDIELYSEEFRADLISIRMQDLKMPSNSQLRRTMKDYSRFFENQGRAAKLAALKSSYTTAGQLHIDILSVLAGADSNTAPGIIRAVLTAGLEPQANDALTAISKFGNLSVLWELIKQYTGYIHVEGSSLLPLASHLLLTALSVTMKDPCLNGLERLISRPHQQHCYDLIQDWLHSEKDEALYEIARAVEAEHRLDRRFSGLELADLLESECFPCINECILRKLMTDISENIIKPEVILAATEKRRTLKGYKFFRNYYEGLDSVALMQQFYQENSGGFHIAEYAGLWKAYTDHYYKMDFFYRQFHTSFRKSLNDAYTALDDLYKSTADIVENLYKTWFLGSLSSQWTKLTGDELSRDARLPGLTQQSDFYQKYVRPLEISGSRVFVIISDALRYETALELKGLLMQGTKGSAKLSAMQAVFPSATKFGMAALLPHSKLELTDEIKVLCDGESTEGTDSREKILKKAHDGNAALTYKTLLGKKQAERREMISNANVVYIYHNTIDAVGDDAATEDQVFEACSRAVLELKNLVRIIINDMNGTHILITADHGFLYSYKPLDESDKAEKSLISGNILELNRRYVIADGDCTAEHMLKIPLNHLNSSLTGFTPQSNIRMKVQGGGSNYVHGGVSLQEMVVPVIEFSNKRVSSRDYVEVRKAALRLMSQSRKISNSMFSLEFYQPEAVSEKVTTATYELYMADAAGHAVSDRKTIIANKTNPDASERTFKAKFTLKGIEFKKTDSYYLTIAEKGTANIIDRIEFTIDIAFVDVFDF